MVIQTWLNQSDFTAEPKHDLNGQSWRKTVRELKNINHSKSSGGKMCLAWALETRVRAGKRSDVCSGSHQRQFLNRCLIIKSSCSQSHQTARWVYNKESDICNRVTCGHWASWLFADHWIEKKMTLTGTFCKLQRCGTLLFHRVFKKPSLSEILHWYIEKRHLNPWETALW